MRAAFWYGVGTEKERRTQGAAIRASGSAGRIAPLSGRSHPRCRREAEEIILKTPKRRFRRGAAARAQTARRPQRVETPLEIARPLDRPAVLLGRRARPVGSDRRGRRRGLGRRASAGDPVAGNPETATDDPDRRNGRQRTGATRRNGRRQCRAEGPAALSAEGLHRDRGPPLLLTLWRRSRRHCARGGDQLASSRRLAGWVDADPAARQEPVPDPGAHPATQIAGGGTCDLAGAQAFQERDPRALSEPGLFRLRRLWRRSRSPTLFRQIGQERHDRRSRDARRPRQIAVAAGAEPQSRGRRAARAKPC